MIFSRMDFSDSYYVARHPNTQPYLIYTLSQLPGIGKVQKISVNSTRPSVTISITEASGPVV